jgi:hypothetical protein
MVKPIHERNLRADDIAVPHESDALHCRQDARKVFPDRAHELSYIVENRPWRA